MNDLKLSAQSRQIIAELASSDIGSFINTALDPPAPFRGSGKIKLIVLGQDPTVQDPKYRESIRVTLLLNQPGRLRTYLQKEIHEFPNVPVLPLGEPVLNCLVESSRCMLISPFPHIPGLSHRIYRSRLDAYVAFMKKAIS